MYKEAISMDRKNALAIFHLGMLYFEEEEYTKAQKYFSKTSLYDSGGMFAAQVNEYLEQLIELCESGECNS